MAKDEKGAQPPASDDAESTSESAPQRTPKPASPPPSEPASQLPAKQSPKSSTRSASKSRSKGAFTDEERGDTVGRPTRAIVRMIVIAVLVLGLVGVALIRAGAFAGTFASVSQVADAAAAAASEAAASATPNPSSTGPASSSTGPAASAAPAVLAPTAAATTPTTAGAAAPTTASTADPTPQAPGELSPLEKSYQAQAALVAAEDARISYLALTGAAPNYPAEPILTPVDRANQAAEPTPPPSVVLEAQPKAVLTIYSLDDLIARGAATRVSDTIVSLTSSVFLQRGVLLTITAPGQTLRMLSTPTGFTSIVSWGGALTLAGDATAPLTITSWNPTPATPAATAPPAADPAAGAPDSTETDGRAYIRQNDGALTTNYVTLDSLGFYSGRTGGLAATGTATAPTLASIHHTVVTNQHTGLFLSSVTGATVSDSSISTSTETGIEITNSSDAVSVIRTTVDGSGGTGIEAQAGSSNVMLNIATITNNGQYGFTFDGKARASGPNPGGYPVADSAGPLVIGSTVTGNRAGGVAVYSSTGVKILTSTISQRGDALLVRDSTAVIQHNTIDVTNGNGNGIVLEGPIVSGWVQHNTISGGGPNAIAQGDGSGTIVVDNNDTSGWSEKAQIVTWAEDHPLALLWGLLLIIPAIGVFFLVARARRLRKIRELVESTTLAIAKAEKAEYESRLLAERTGEGSLESELVGAGAGGASLASVGMTGSALHDSSPTVGSAGTASLPGDFDAGAADRHPSRHDVKPRIVTSKFPGESVPSAPLPRRSSLEMPEVWVPPGQQPVRHEAAAQRPAQSDPYGTGPNTYGTPGPQPTPTREPQSQPSQSPPPQAYPPQAYPPQSAPPRSTPPQGPPPQGPPPQAAPPQWSPPQSSPPQPYPGQPFAPAAAPSGVPPAGRPPVARPPIGRPAPANPTTSGSSAGQPGTPGASQAGERQAGVPQLPGTQPGTPRPGAPRPGAPRPPAPRTNSRLPVGRPYPAGRPAPTSSAAGATGATGGAGAGTTPPPPSAPQLPTTKTSAATGEALGRFRTVEELAVSAVLDGGKPITTVAKTLRVSTSIVASWVAKAQRDHRP